MEFCEIEISEIGKYVEIAFEGDNELVEKFHYSDKTLEETITGNVANIQNLNSLYPLTCYCVKLFDSIEIGFVVLRENLLYSFGINKKYRTKEILKEWWEIIKAILEYQFVVCLYPENTRAIDFFVRNGMKIKETTDNNITLIFKQY